MYFDIDDLDAARSYKLLSGTVLPRPIAWVVTRNAEGLTNAAPFSFFNCFGGHPPVLAIGIGQRDRADKDTLANLRRHGEYVINLVSEDLAEAMTETSTDFPAHMDELATVGLETAPSTRIDVPRIAASPVAYECRLKQILEVDGSGHIALGNVLAVHIVDEAVLNADKCYVDPSKLHLIGRMQSPGGYTRTQDTFRIRQLDYAGWQSKQADGRRPT